MLKNRLYVFAPSCVADIITPGETRVINKWSGLFDELTEDVPWMRGGGGQRKRKKDSSIAVQWCMQKAEEWRTIELNVVEKKCISSSV